MPATPSPAHHTITRHAEVLAVLTDPNCTVPPAPATAALGWIGWLRANVARFSAGAAHRRRRMLAVTALAGVDAAVLRRRAREQTTAVLAAAGGAPVDLMSQVARTVPVGVLADALGVAAPADTVAVTAQAYHPHGRTDPAANQAVAQLVDACGGAADEATAATIGLLVQACDATAGLVGNAVLALGRQGPHVEVEAILNETLRSDPPVRATRRMATVDVRVGAADVPAGTVMVLDIAAANRDPAVFAGPDRFDVTRTDRHLTFGAGPRACPGRHHAVAVASGILEAVRGCRLLTESVEYAPSANLRVPVRLEVTTP